MGRIRDCCRLRITLPMVSVGLLLLSGCAATFPPPVEGILNNGDSYQLMLVSVSFDPNRPSSTPQFHRCFVEKTVTLADTASRRKLIAVVQGNVINGGSVTGCAFTPHYGVHIARGSQTLDMLICFHCMQCEVFVNGAEQGGYSVRPEGKKYFAALAGEHAASGTQ